MNECGCPQNLSLCDECEYSDVCKRHYNRFVWMDESYWDEVRGSEPKARSEE